MVIYSTPIRIVGFRSFTEMTEIDYGFDVWDYDNYTYYIIPILTKNRSTENLNTRWSGHKIESSHYKRKEKISKEINFNYSKYGNGNGNYICIINGESLFVSNKDSEELFVLNFKESIYFKIRLYDEFSYSKDDSLVLISKLLPFLSSHRIGGFNLNPNELEKQDIEVKEDIIFRPKN
jgi:hypothetical protein